MSFEKHFRPATMAPPVIGKPSHSGAPAVKTSDQILAELLSSRTITPDLISYSPELVLLLLLPLVLNVIQRSFTPALLIHALQQRIHKSRLLKLRCLLLLKHPAFSSLLVKHRYNSMAFQKAMESEQLRPSNSIALTVLVDMVDLQSADFFENHIYVREIDEGARLGQQIVCNPFSRINFDSFELSTETVQDLPLTEETYAQCALVVEKRSRHVLLELRFRSIESEDVEVHNLSSITPQLIVRDKENVLKTTTTQILFLFFNHVWLVSPKYFSDPDTAPFCRTYDSIPTAESRGFEEHLLNSQTLHSFDFSAWKRTKGRDPTIVDELIRSAAGAFAAAYVCGVYDQSLEAFAIQNGECCFLRDFRNIFHHCQPRRPGVHLIPRAMKSCLQSIKAWDIFVDTSVRAFCALQASCEDLIRLLIDLYARSGVAEHQVRQYLNTIIVTKNGVKNEQKTIQLFRKWLT